MAKKATVAERELLADVFRYEDASKDDNILTYLVSRQRYADDLDSRSVIVYGSAGCGKTALLADFERHFRESEGRRTCRTQFRSLQRLSDQLRYQANGLSEVDAARYVVDVWMLVELASEFHFQLITGRKSKTVREAAVKLGLAERDPIERVAAWVTDNINGLFTALGTIFGADPGTAKAAGNVASSILANEELGIVTRISRASDALAEHELMESLVFQIDDFDSSYSHVPTMAQLVEEYLRVLYDVTSGGTIAPYAVAVSSALFEYRRREGWPLKFASRPIFVQPWDAEELWGLLQKRFKTALGKTRAKQVADSIGINFNEIPESPWSFGGRDGPSPLGALPIPRSLVRLWQEMVKHPLSNSKPSRAIWKTHLALAAMEAEAYLAARYRGITPLLRELEASPGDTVNKESFFEIRKKTIDAAPSGALWIAARIEDLMESFSAAGILAGDPDESGDFRIRRALLPSAG